MQETIQTQAIGIEGVGSQLTGQLPEFLLDGLRHTHIKNALHQCLDGEEVGVDVFEVGHGLMQSISRFLSGTDWRGMGMGIDRTRTVLLLKVFQHPAREGAKRLECGPAEFLLLAQGGCFADQSVVLSVKPLAVRALTGLFRHVTPFRSTPIMTSD